MSARDSGKVITRLEGARRGCLVAAAIFAILFSLPTLLANDIAYTIGFLAGSILLIGGMTYVICTAAIAVAQRRLLRTTETASGFDTPESGPAPIDPK